MNTIQRLRDLTKQLPPMDIAHPSVLEYATKNGTCIGMSLFNIPEISVQRAFMSSGAEFPHHQHESHEYLVVYIGCIVLSMKEQDIEIRPAQCVHVPPDTRHTVRALEDTWMIGITVPAEEGYPHAPYTAERME